MNVYVSGDASDGDDPGSLAIDLYAELSRYQDSSNLSSSLRAFLDLSWADMWIGNGGFIGLWQTRAATIRRLPEAAERIGAPAFAALFRDANRVLPAGTLDNDAALHGWLDSDHDAAFAALVDELDARYHATGDLAEAIGRFVLANPHDFPRPAD
jgi:hypothetical protein